MNMTPIIDVVFLLIIFFLLVSQFVEAENFEVTVLDNCAFAEKPKEQAAQITTLTILKTEAGDEFAPEAVLDSPAVESGPFLEHID